MDKNSTTYQLLKVLFILAFLPFVLIWGVWEKTNWSKTIKWLATVGMVVVFLLMIASGNSEKKNENTSLPTVEDNQKINNLERQLKAEKQKNAEIDNNKIVQEESKQSEVSKVYETTPAPTSQKSIAPPAIQSTSTGGGYACNCSKTCPQMSCAEAQYQLNTCGCTRRDADHDGTACNAQCQ